MSNEAVSLTQALIDEDNETFNKYRNLASVRKWIDEKVFANELKRVSFGDGQEYTSCLLYALTKSRAEVVRALVGAGASLKIRDSFENTVLHSACASKIDRVQKVSFLLKKDKSLIDVHNVHENSPLHIACLNGYDDVIGLLVVSGADVDVEGQNGSTPVSVIIVSIHYCMCTSHVLLFVVMCSF